MKCYVCGKTYTGNVCPRCRFPAVEVPNTTWEQGRLALAATIAPFRAAFLESIRVSMIAFYHRDENGFYVPDREEEILLGTGTALYENEVWLDREFARREDQPSIRIHLRLTTGSNTRQELVEVPNLHAPELQKLGITMDDQFQIRLKLRNTSETPTCSNPLEL